MIKLLLPPLLLLVILVAGCNPRELREDLEREADGQVTQHFIDLLESGNFDQLREESLAEIQGQWNPELVELMADAWPDEEPVERALVSAHTFRTSEWITYRFQFQYRFPGDSLRLLSIAYLYPSQYPKPKLVRLHIELINTPLEVQNDLSLANTPAVLAPVIAVAFLVPVFIVVSLVVCIRTPMPKRKWLWLVFMSMGVGGFTFNMATAGFEFHPVTFLLFGSGFQRASAYAPMMLTTSIPLGAILFWHKWVGLRRQKDAEVSEPVPEESAQPD